MSLKIYGNEKLGMRGGCRTPGAARLFVAQSVDGVHFGGLVGGVVAEEQADGKPVRSERYHGVQSRSFALAQDVDETRASATYRDGVLELRLPKKAGSARTQLTIE